MHEYERGIIQQEENKLSDEIKEKY